MKNVKYKSLFVFPKRNPVHTWLIPWYKSGWVGSATIWRVVMLTAGSPVSKRIHVPSFGSPIQYFHSYLQSHLFGHLQCLISVFTLRWAISGRKAPVFGSPWMRVLDEAYRNNDIDMTESQNKATQPGNQYEWNTRWVDQPYLHIGSTISQLKDLPGNTKWWVDNETENLLAVPCWFLSNKKDTTSVKRLLLGCCASNWSCNAFRLKPESCHDANFVVTGDCHNDNFRCRQWRSVISWLSYNNCNPGGPVGLPQGCKPIHWNPNTFLERKVCWQIAQKLQKTSVANFTYLFWTLYFASRTKNKLKQLYFNGAVSMFFQQSLHLPKNKQPKWRLLWSHDPWDHISWFPLPSLGPSPMENPMLKG